MIDYKNSQHIDVSVISRHDTSDEVLIYEAGGVLQRFAKDFLEGKVDVATTA